MIVIKIEMWPKGDETAKRDLGSAVITNDLTGTALRGNYHVRLLRKGADHSKRLGTVWKRGRVIGFKRKRGPFDLLLQALQNTIGEKS